MTTKTATTVLMGFDTIEINLVLYIYEIYYEIRNIVQL